MKEKQKERLEQLHKKGPKGKVLKHILEVFCHVIKIECKGKTNYTKRSYDVEVKEAIQQQQMIEVDLMLRFSWQKDGWRRWKNWVSAPTLTGV